MADAVPGPIPGIVRSNITRLSSFECRRMRISYQRQPKGTFATFVRGLTERAVPISFPFFVLEKLPRSTKDEVDAARQHSRECYAEPLRRTAEHTAPEEPEPSEAEGKFDEDDPTKPSPKL